MPKATAKFAVSAAAMVASVNAGMPTQSSTRSNYRISLSLSLSFVCLFCLFFRNFVRLYETNERSLDHARSASVQDIADGDATPEQRRNRAERRARIGAARGADCCCLFDVCVRLVSADWCFGDIVDRFVLIGDCSNTQSFTSVHTHITTRSSTRPIDRSTQIESKLIESLTADVPRRLDARDDVELDQAAERARRHRCPHHGAETGSMSEFAPDFFILIFNFVAWSIWIRCRC